MTRQFDVDKFRAAKASSVLPIGSIHGVVVQALCSRPNIELWKAGIENPAPEAGDAYSHFSGFRQTMVAAAAEAARKAEGDSRYAANDLEEALCPKRVSRYLDGIHSDVSEGDLRRSAASFLQSSLEAAQAARPRLAARP